MKPLPAQGFPTAKPRGEAMPALPSAIAPAAAAYSTSNRRTTQCPVQRVYPWLLFASTALAGVFCLMYITKPMIMASSSGATAVNYNEQPAIAKPAATPAANGKSLMPSAERLPGEAPAPTRKALPPHPGADRSFEETNLRVQHVLTAETPGGQLARIDIDVPVLYQSRNLRWTAAEVTEARALLIRLADYQEKSRLLRAEGAELLDSWNRLVGRSIPAGDLRADSPTLPVNQLDAADAPRPAGLNTMESIKIQPSHK
jgi:hypothetical protein